MILVARKFRARGARPHWNHPLLEPPGLLGHHAPSSPRLPLPEIAGRNVLKHYAASAMKCWKSTIGKELCNMVYKANVEPVRSNYYAIAAASEQAVRGRRPKIRENHWKARLQGATKTTASEVLGLFFVAPL